MVAGRDFGNDGTAEVAEVISVGGEAERVTREVRSIIEQEVIELNRHRFTREPTAPDHVSGIYQYLERVSRAVGRTRALVDDLQRDLEREASEREDRGER